MGKCDICGATDTDELNLGDYIITVKDNKTVSIHMDDGEGGDFSLGDFIDAIEEFYMDNY